MKIRTIAKSLVCIALIFSMYLVTPAKTQALTADEITAPSAVLMEEESGKVLFEKNSHEKRACASVTKVMTLLLVFGAIDSGKISMTDIVTTSAHAASMGGSDIWLEEGETMTVDEMIKATVVASANDAAVALAEMVCGSEEEFVRQMNERAKTLQMKDTTFKNCNGLDEEGHLTSAYDVALMSRELIKHTDIYKYSGIWMDYLRDGATQLVNTNKLLKTYNGITGLKTGTTSQAGSCISATAKRDNLSLIAVVLGSKTGKERFSDASALLDYGFANYTTVTPKLQENPKAVEVKEGMQKQVATAVELFGKFLIKKGEEESVESKITYKEEITAPVEKGQKVGTVEFYSNKEKLAEYDIKTQNAVEKITFGSVFSLLFRSLTVL